LKSLAELGQLDRTRNASDFVRLAAYLASKGSFSSAAMAAEQDRASPRIVSALKAAVSVARLADNIGDFGILSQGFIASLSSFGAFDAVRAAGAVRLPFTNPRVEVSATAATGDAPGEGVPWPVSSVSIAPGTLTTAWGAAVIVLTRELLQLGSAGVLELLQTELRRAAIASVDAGFFDVLAAGAPTVSGAADVLSSLADAAEAMSLDAGARLVLIAPAAAVRSMAFQGGSNGQLYPSLTVAGGVLAGVRIVPVDNLPLAGSPSVTSAILVDATQIATADDGLELDATGVADLQMSDAPAGGAQQMTSMWQIGARAISIRRRVGYAKLNQNAACTIDDPSW
jgi:hypothetical protein